MTNADHWERKCLNRCGNPDSLYPAGYEDNSKPPEHEKAIHWKSKRQVCCEWCHECGARLRVVLDGELWCDKCQGYK